MLLSAEERAPWASKKAVLRSMQDALLWQGSFVAFVLAVGWALAASMRRRERRRLQSADEAHCSAQQASHAAGIERELRHASPDDQRNGSSAHHGVGWPGVTVVLPVGACRPRSLDNWASHLRMQYRGALEFVFVAQSREDPAWDAVERLRHEASCTSTAANGSLQAPHGQPQHTASVASSAQAARRRQPTPPQGSAPDAVAARRPGAEGAPVDEACASPQPLAVRLLAAGPSTTCSQKIHNLVAGCRASSGRSAYVLFLDDDVELHPRCLEQLVDVMQRDRTLFMATGYPFDLPPTKHASVATYCTLVYHLPLLIAFSVSQRTSFVWGGCMLLRRELLVPEDVHGVLEAWQDGGYSDDLLLAALCTRKGLGIAVPSFALFPQWLEARYTWRQYANYLHRQLFVLDTYANRHNRLLNHTMMAVHAWASAAWAASALLVILHGALWLVASASAVLLQGSAAQQPAPWRLPGLPPPSAVPLAAFLLCCGAAHASLHWMSGEVLALLVQLAPGRPLSARPGRHLSFARLWLGMLVESCVLPACMLYTLLCPTVQWAGIWYRKRSGKVVRLRGPTGAADVPHAAHDGALQGGK